MFIPALMFGFGGVRLYVDIAVLITSFKFTAEYMAVGWG